jgi:hypothetical protein
MQLDSLQIRLKWTSRIVGLLVCIFFFFFAVGEVLPSFNQYSDLNSLLFILFLSASVAGYVASWQWEILGAWVQLAGGICMFIFMQRQNEIFLGVIFGMPFVFTGSLLIYSRIVGRLRQISSQQ